MATNKIQKILNDLKSLIRFMRQHRNDLNQDQHKQKFLFEQKSLSNRIDALCDADKDWIDKEYKKWYEKEMLPFIKKEQVTMESK